MKIRINVSKGKKQDTRWIWNYYTPGSVDEINKTETVHTDGTKSTEYFANWIETLSEELEA